MHLRPGRSPEPGRQLRGRRPRGAERSGTAPGRLGPMSAGVERANERGAAPEAVLGTRPGGRRGGRSHGRWACGGAEGARATAGRGWRDRRRDWPSTLRRGGVPAGAGRACERERGASEEPGSGRPPQWGACLAAERIGRTVWAHLGVRGPRRARFRGRVASAEAAVHRRGHRRGRARPGSSPRGAPGWLS